MKPIKQTPFGRFLCWLGIHSLCWGQYPDRGDGTFSIYGGCVRCNSAFGWDS